MNKARTLPEGWRLVRFGDVVSNVKGTTKDPAGDGLECVVGLDHLDSESLPLRRWDLLDELPDGTSFSRTFRAGQVLFGKRRAYQRKVSVPTFDGICSGDILVFEPCSPGLLSEFLPYIVQSDGFLNHALGTSAGSLSPRTKWQELAKYEFALPPIDEQKRLAAIMNEVDGLAAQYVDCLGRALAVEEAHFREMLSSRYVPLGEILEEPPRNGLTIDPVDSDTGNWSLTVGSVGEFGYQESGLRPIRNTELGSAIAVPGDLFVSRSNTLERVGLPFRFPGADGTVVYSDLLMRIRLRPGTLRLGVLETYLRSKPARRYVRSIAAGTSASMKKINAANLKRMPVPVLAPEAQDSIETMHEAVVGVAAALGLRRGIAADLRRGLLEHFLGQGQS